MARVLLLFGLCWFAAGCAASRPNSPWHNPQILPAESELYGLIESYLQTSVLAPERRQALERRFVYSPQRAQLVVLLIKVLAHDRLLAAPGQERTVTNRHREDCARLLGLIGPAALAAVLQAAAEEGFPPAWRAPLVSVLGWIAAPPARLPPLHRREGSEEPRAAERQAVLQALVGFLAREQGEQAEEFRSRAATALGEIGAPEAVAPLLARLAAEADPLVRARLAEALGRIRAPQTLAPLLERLAAEREYVVRARLVEALGQLGDPRALPALEALDTSARLVAPEQRVDFDEFVAARQEALNRLRRGGAGP